MSYAKKSFGDIYDSMAADARERVPQLSDFEEGSVIRSLLESFGAELALLYEQLDLVYQSGFVDTADGPNLDRVVAILGLKRNEPDYATGMVTFTRDPGSNVDLTIPIGTLVTTEEKPDQDPPKKSYLTTQVGHMAAGKDSADVPVQAAVPGRQMTSDAGTVIVMPRPVPGVKSLTNAEPIRFLGRDRESDDQLRQRAKEALLASGRASVTSIENALLGMPGVRDVHVTEEATAGVIKVYVDGLTAQNSADIRQRIDEVRAAGIYAALLPAVAVNLDAVLQIDVNPKIQPEERTKLEESARDAVINLVDSLGMGRPLLFSQLAAAILKVNGVNDLVQFEMATFLDADAFAAGQVTLHRPAAKDALTIPADTPIRTMAGQQFRLTGEAKFAGGDKDESVTVPLEAVSAGRAGELLRTGSAANWESLSIGGSSITVDNSDPIRLARTSYKLTDRSIPIQVLQRLVPNSIRVASEIKPLPVRVQIRLQDPSGRDAKRQPLEAAVRAFFQDLAAKPDRSFTKADLTAKLNSVMPTPGAFDLRLVAFAFQGHTPQDDFRVDASFVEKPEAEIIFVYTDRVLLTGSMNLILSLTATPEEKRVTAGLARQALADYLDSLGPEEQISLDQFQQIASGVDKVLRVEFKPESCGLLDAQGNPLQDRVQGTRATVKAFEKAFLSDDKFVIQA